MGILGTGMTAGCSGPTLNQGPGGLAPNIADRVSFIVAQTRAQLPERSGMGIPFEARKTGPEEGASPEPALIGEGIGVRPGLQSDKQESVRMELSLDKLRYAEGFARVAFAGAEAEEWPIVAYDLSGEPNGNFEHSYALVTTQGTLRYLVLIGGNFEEDGQSFRGFEGTLIVPGKDRDPESWQEAYKIDFGYRFPVSPPHERKVEEADDLFKVLGRKSDAMERMQSDIAKVEGELASQQIRPSKSVSAADHQASLDNIQSRLDALRAKLDQTLIETRSDFIRYYRLRQEIAGEFKAFLDSNHYRWQPLAARQAIFDRWRTVEYHHPRIDERFHRFLRDVRDTKELLEARKKAMDVITGTNNWDRDPSKAAEPPAPPTE